MKRFMGLHWIAAAALACGLAAAQTAQTPAKDAAPKSTQKKSAAKGTSSKSAAAPNSTSASKPNPAPAPAMAKSPTPAPAPANNKVEGMNMRPELPKTAVEVEPNLWRFTDDKGQVWMYRKTPFGFSKYRQDQVASTHTGTLDPDVEESRHLTAVEEGDTVRFERKTPFGVNKWTRKKDNLSTAERMALDRAQGKSSAPSTAAAKPAQE